MARSRWRGHDDPNSAQNQFFINVKDKQESRLPPDGGYAVFGKVIDGMDVVDKIAKVKTTTTAMTHRRPHDNVPVEPVVIKTARRKAQEMITAQLARKSFPGGTLDQPGNDF